MDDVSLALSKTRNRLKKLEFELELEKKSVQVLRRKLAKDGSWPPLKALFDEAARYVNAYAKDCNDRGLDIEPLKLMAIKSGVIGGGDDTES